MLGWMKKRNIKITGVGDTKVRGVRGKVVKKKYIKITYSYTSDVTVFFFFFWQS